MTTLNRIYLVLSYLALLPAATQAQSIHTLQGNVILPGGGPPSRSVRVTLSFNGATVYQSFTDLAGHFNFPGLRAGTYQLTADGDQETYETTTVYAEVSASGNAPKIFTQNVQLRSKQGKAVPKAAVVSVEEVDPNIPDRARKEYQLGVKSAGSDKAEQAIKHFNEAMAAYPRFYAAQAAIAEQYVKLQRYDQAVQAYKKAIELKPERAAAYVGLGVTLVKEKKYGEAIPLLRRSLEIDHDSSSPYLFLGFAEMMSGDYEPAEKDLVRAYEIGKPAIAHIYLANLYDLRREPDKAIEQLQAFLKENPEAPNASQIREVIDKLRKQISSKK